MLVCDILIKNLGVIQMSFLKKPGRIILLTMIVLAVVCPYRVHMYKTNV